MTDKETSLEFVERMERTSNTDRQSGPNTLRYDDIERLISLAKTAALIDEHKLNVAHIANRCKVFAGNMRTEYDCQTVHQAVRAVADKIKEQA